MQALNNQDLLNEYINASESGDSYSAYQAGAELVRRGIDGSEAI